MGTFDMLHACPLDHALALRASGDIEGAITFLFKAVGDSLADRGLVITLAKMLSETGNLERAEHWFRHAIKIAPDDLDVQFGYGTFLAQSGRLPEARAQLESAQALARACDEPVDVRGLILAIDLNLARVCLELADFSVVRVIVTPWLTDVHGWGAAHDVFVDLVVKLGLDPTDVDEEGLASGHISPFMVCHRLEQYLESEPLDLLGFERVVARADTIFDFDWRRSADEIEAVVAQGRKAAVHAIMRGSLEADLVPHLLSNASEHHPAASEVDEAEIDGFESDDSERPDFDGDGAYDPAFQRIIRLAGWNDFEPDIEIVVVRRERQYFLETTSKADPVALDEHVARWLVSIFARAVAGFPPPRLRQTIPVDRNWLIEGFGCSKVVRFDRFGADEWPLVYAAITVCQLESTLVATIPGPNPPFTALVMALDPMVANERGVAVEDGLIEVKACWTDDGFVFARQARLGDPIPDPVAFFERASPDLVALVPELEQSMPCLVHPVAAWALIGVVTALKVTAQGKFRDDWLEYCDKPIRTSGYVATRNFAELGY